MTGELSTRMLSLTLSTKSDWATGTGHGRHGGVDSVIERDASGLPFVRGKTLVSLLHDEARALAAALDSAETAPHVTDALATPWASWLDHLFGSRPARGGDRTHRLAPRPSALRARPLTLVDADDFGRPAFGLEAAELVQGLTRTRPHVRINEATGTAADESLRTAERAIGGLELTAVWTMLTHPAATSTAPTDAEPQKDDLPADWPALLLLLGSARALERLGADRRRGAGRVELTITVGAPDDDASTQALLPLMLERVDRGHGIPSPPDHHPAGAAGTSVAAASASSSPLSEAPLVSTLDLALDLIDPVIVNAGTRGNVLESLDSVPGTLLLPLVARALGDRASALIRAGRIVVSDAVLEVDGRTSSPWPESLLVSKNEANAPTGTEATRGVADSPRWKPESGARLSGSGRTATVDRVPIVLRMHNATDPEFDRPTTRSGGPFAYTGIAAGTRLRSTVLLPEGLLDMDETTELVQALSAEVQLGTSKKDDYGSVRLSATPATSASAEARPRAVDEMVRMGTRLRVVLESDLLAVDDAGDPQPTAHGVVDALRAAGLDVRLAEFAPDEGMLVAMVRARRRESWQVGWGLPRTSIIAAQAGGVVVVEAQSDLDYPALDRLHREGAGSRRAEGFGRVQITPLNDVPEQVDLYRESSPANRASVDDSVAESTMSIDSIAVRRAWQRRIREAAERAAADPRRRASIIPPGVGAAQLGSLRDAAMSIGLTPSRLDVGSAQGWLVSTMRSVGTGSPWPEATRATLTALFSPERGAVWGELGFSAGDTESHDLPASFPIPEEVRGASWFPALEREAIQLLVTLSVRAEISGRRSRQ